MISSNCKPTGSLIEFSPVVYLVLLFSRFYFESEQLSFIVTLLLIFYGYYLLFALFGFFIFEKYVIGIFVCMTFGWLINLQINDYNLFAQGVQYFSNLGFAFALLKSKMRINAYLTVLIIFYLFVFYLATNGINPEGVFTVSRNFFSIFYILIVSLYFLACQKNNEKPNIIVPMLGIGVVVWAIGRAGILTGILIFLGTAVLNMNRRNIFKMIFFWGVISFLVIYNTDLDVVVSQRFQSEGLESDRNDINSDYLAAVFENVHGLLFGVDFNKIPSIVNVDGNSHNSFISLHYVFGILGFATISMLILRKFFKFWINSEYLLMLILAVSLLRSIFDSAAFHGPLDVVISYCLFYGSNVKKNFR